MERDVLSAVSHPFVVSLHCAYQTRHHLYLALDYCGGGDLALHIRHGEDVRLPESTSRFVCAEVLLAVEALHEAGVIHRDLKAENVLVDSYGHIRLADMNAAKLDNRLSAGGRTYSVVGTPCCGSRGASGQDGLFICSRLVVIRRAALRVPRWPTSTRKTRSWCTPRRGWSMRSYTANGAPLPDGLSEAAAGLVDRLLERDESVRLSQPDELRAHAFFDGMEWAPLLAKQIPSPLLPSVQEGGNTWRRGCIRRQLRQAGCGWCGCQREWRPRRAGRVCLSIRSLRLRLETHSPATQQPRSADPSGGFHGRPRRVGLRCRCGEEGERLWRHIRSRIDQLARLQGLSRAQFLTCLLLKLAGASSNRIGEAADEAPSDEIPTVA